MLFFDFHLVNLLCIFSNLAVSARILGIFFVLCVFVLIVLPFLGDLI